MKIGVCLPPDKAELAKEAGFDYLEVPLNKIGVMSDDEWKKAKETIKRASIPVLSASLLLPKDMRAYGPGYDWGKMEEYLDRAFKRLRELGGSIVVFGSGKSRCIPEGYDWERSFRELLEVTKRIVEKAREYEITIVIEPLNKSECDIINSLFMARVLSDLSGASLLSDAYHMMVEGESMDDLLLYAPIRHAHIATLEGRRYPRVLDDALKAFIENLKKIGYEGNISIEGKSENILEDSKEALRAIKEAYFG